MNNSESASYRAGEAKGQAQEKGSQLLDKASNAAQSAKESVQEVNQILTVMLPYPPRAELTCLPLM